MLKKFWFLALVAIVLGTGTTTFVLLKNIGHSPSAPAVALPEKVEITLNHKNWDLWTEEIGTLSSDLKAERTALEVRGKDLDALEHRLTAEKEEMKKLRTELEAVRDEITRSVPVIQASESKNVKALARTYSTMKPAQAVTILAEMDDANIVKLLAGMKPDVAGAIFQEMAKPGATDNALAARAAKLSDQLRLMKKEPTETPAP